MPIDMEKKRLVASILHFLRGEFRLSTDLSEENKEGLEVAIQCIETVYEVGNTTETDPPLLDIFKSYLSSSILNKPDATESDKKEAERLKTEGNSAMNASLFGDAIDLYTKAINHDPKNAVYYCNRAAAYSKLHNYNQSIIDCKMAIEIDPTYSKAYGRLGLAYCGLEDYLNALDNYKKALELEPSNEGYRKNYDLAVMKVNEFRFGSSGNSEPGRSEGSAFGDMNVNANSQTPSQSTANRAGAHNGGGDQLPQAASFGFGAAQADLASFLTNPRISGYVQQMLSEPNMQHMMNTLVNNTFNDPNNPSRGQIGVEEILQVGQRLAQQMQSEHPGMIDEIRQVLESQAESGETNSQSKSGQPPENKKGGGPGGDQN